jgi:biotin carboxyl carrier protein
MPTPKRRNRGDRARHEINHQVVVFDAAELAAEGEFWAGVARQTLNRWIRDWRAGGFELPDPGPRPFRRRRYSTAEKADRTNSGHVAAPFAGVVSLSVAEGDQVNAGATVATIEAMMMEAAITAPVAGPVQRLAIGPCSRLRAATSCG